MCCAGSCAARCATRSCSARSEPLMHRLVWALVREMGQAYPDLVRAEKLIEETLRLEETRFRKTLARGLSILDEKSAGLKKGDMFDGDTAFTLYDTYGFPLDLTQDALKSRGISVDQASFTDAMDRQREKARASWSGSGDAATENVWFPLREKLGATEFLGYETESAEGVVTALVKDGKEADSLKAGETGAIVLNQTPFYAESGGQVGDTGVLTGEGVKFRVTDTQKKAGDLFVHLGTVEQGTLKLGDGAAARGRSWRRSSIRAHHSATHLLHEALRQVLIPGAGTVTGGALRHLHHRSKSQRSRWTAPAYAQSWRRATTTDCHALGQFPGGSGRGRHDLCGSCRAGRGSLPRLGAH